MPRQNPYSLSTDERCTLKMEYKRSNEIKFYFIFIVRPPPHSIVVMSHSVLLLLALLSLAIAIVSGCAQKATSIERPRYCLESDIPIMKHLTNEQKKKSAHSRDSNHYDFSVMKLHASVFTSCEREIMSLLNRDKSIFASAITSYARYCLHWTVEICIPACSFMPK